MIAGAAVVIGCLIVLRPFLAALLSAAILCFSSWPAYLLMIAVTGAANVLQNRAARFLPFGLRSALMISTRPGWDLAS